MLAAQQDASALAISPLDCRVLPHIEADGPFQMGLDEAMLESVDADPSIVLWRTYSWSEPTLSLGYFQSAQALELEPRWRNIAFVRRPTGGGAILHDHELTYALALPRSHALAQTPETLYKAVHEAIALALQAAGVPARLLEGPAKKNQHDARLLCFTRRGPLDIVLLEAKIVGSAQRRRCGTVLQHGSLLLRRSTLTPELLGLGDLVPVDADALSWSARLRQLVPRSLGFVVRETAIADRQRARAQVLAETVYRNPAWNHRR